MLLHQVGLALDASLDEKSDEELQFGGGARLSQINLYKSHWSPVRVVITQYKDPIFSLPCSSA
jgi:hypothetical protein